LNDHDALRHDPLVAVLAELTDLGAPGAGKSTLNRLEFKISVYAGRFGVALLTHGTTEC